MRTILFLLLFFFLMVLNTASCKEETKGSPREPAQAGGFYPAEPNRLRTMISQSLTQVKEAPGEFPRALIVPHAGYQYSGPVAAHAYRILQSNATEIKRVILLATCHYSLVQGVVVNERDYKTPLGIYPVDKKAVAEFLKHQFPHVKNEVEATQEHSDEVQIPFLQTVLPKALLVPVIVGEMNDAGQEATARALSSIVDQNTVIIASSDFTHYGPRFGYTPGFKSDKRAGIHELDQGAINWIIRGDRNQFQAYLRKTGATICGRNPIALLLKMFEVNNWPANGRLLKYSTSGDLTGDWQNSVSYAAISIGALKKTAATEEKKLLTHAEEQTLLKLSRYVLTNFITKGITEFPDSSLKDFKITEILKQKLGVFVTLKKHDALRGCIGYIMGYEPLYQAVIENTKNSSARDPRFPKVTSAELKELDIEISVLSPMEKVKSLDEIKVGRDGLVLKNGFNSGVFLPQVPMEQHWDKTTYLEQLGLKAGLGRTAYRDPDTELFRFTAQVFGERE